MAFSLISNKPNPLYLFSIREVFDVANEFLPQEEREAIGLNYVYLDFCSERSLRQALPLMNLEHYRECWKDRTFIALTVLPSPLRTPHHVNEDGSLEMMPGRDGPIRTYFDGSTISSLVRTAVTCINHEYGTITTQCPRGLEFPEPVEETIAAVYGDFKRVKITDVQQTDEHSSNLYCLYNMMAMSHLRQPRSHIDVAAWRSEVMDILKDHEAAEAANDAKTAPAATAPTPIFRKRYI